MSVVKYSSRTKNNNNNETNRMKKRNRKAKSLEDLFISIYSIFPLLLLLNATVAINKTNRSQGFAQTEIVRKSFEIVWVLHCPRDLRAGWVVLFCTQNWEIADGFRIHRA